MICSFVTCTNPRVDGSVYCLDHQFIGEPVTFDDLRRASIQRIDEVFNMAIDDWSINDWVVAVCGECGEIADAASKLREFGTPRDFEYTEHVDLQANLRHEIADTMIFLDMLALRVGMDLGAEIRDTFNRKSAITWRAQRWARRRG